MTREVSSSPSRRDLMSGEWDEFVVWRAAALHTMPYIASLVFSLRPVAAPGLGTMAVDRWHRIYIDFDAMKPHGVRLCSQVLLHECCHILCDHAARAERYGSANHRAWNVAADIAINDDLEAAGCSELAALGVTPAHFGFEVDQTVEWYMDKLADAISPEGSPVFEGCGSGAGGSPAPVEAGSESAQPDGTPAGASHVEHERVLISTASEIRQAARKGIGNVPAGLIEVADMILLPPKVSWKTVLASFFRRYIAIQAGHADYTYSRRRRNRPSYQLADGRKIVNPGLMAPQVSFAVVRDTSGSMDMSNIERATSEIAGISRDCGVRDRDLVVLDTDAEVHKIRRFKGADSLAEVYGRGGTDMGVGIEAACKLRPRPSAIVVLTDGYTPWPAEMPSVPIVVCLIGSNPETSGLPSWAAKVVMSD